MISNNQWIDTTISWDYSWYVHLLVKQVLVLYKVPISREYNNLIIANGVNLYIAFAASPAGESEGKMDRSKVLTLEVPRDSRSSQTIWVTSSALPKIYQIIDNHGNLLLFSALYLVMA